MEHPEGPRAIASSRRSSSSFVRRNSAISNGNLTDSLYRRDSNISKYDICHQCFLSSARSNSVTALALCPMSRWLMKRSES